MEIPSILFLPSNRVWRTYPGGMKLDLMEGREHPVATKAFAFSGDKIGPRTALSAPIIVSQ
jgi:hypothetical protein